MLVHGRWVANSEIPSEFHRVEIYQYRGHPIILSDQLKVGGVGTLPHHGRLFHQSLLEWFLLMITYRVSELVNPRDYVPLAMIVAGHEGTYIHRLLAEKYRAIRGRHIEQTVLCWLTKSASKLAPILGWVWGHPDMWWVEGTKLHVVLISKKKGRLKDYLSESKDRYGKLVVKPSISLCLSYLAVTILP